MEKSHNKEKKIDSDHLGKTLLNENIL